MATALLPASSAASDTSSCAFAAPIQSLPSFTCPSGNGTRWSSARIHSSAWTFAPTLHFHPLEEWLLTDPAVYFQASTLYDRFYTSKGPAPAAASAANMSAAQQQLQAALLTRSFITVLGKADPDREQVMRGAPLDANNRSTARVFYQVTRHGGALVYTYSLFYAHNG